MKKVIITGIISIVILVLSYLVLKNSENKVPKIDNTELRVVNNSQDSILLFLTLSGYNYPQDTLYVQNVNGIFGCSQTGLQGSVWLKANDSLSYISTKYLSGNISFGVAPLNCPDSVWKTGMNLFEFNLNEPQESIDISCMAGVNCILKCNLIGGPNWLADTCLNARVLQNDTMYNNTNRVGVYPYGCTNCTNTQGKQTCQTPSETPNTYNICNPTRAKNKRGGIVRLAFLRYSNWQIAE